MNLLMLAGQLACVLIAPIIFVSVYNLFGDNK